MYFFDENDAMLFIMNLNDFQWMLKKTEQFNKKCESENVNIKDSGWSVWQEKGSEWLP